MLLIGDCFQKILEIEDNSVQTIVTSPPYWGLRNYEDNSVQLGQEPSPEMFVSKLVELFSLCKRILKDDGTLWLNLGDTYFGAKGGHWEGGNSITNDTTGHNYRLKKKAPQKHSYLKTKDLVGIPWLTAIALQRDGWYLRQDIIWNKPNPMPEGVKDRCTKTHEYIFLLSKSSKYYYNADAIKEPVKEVSLKRAEYGWDCDRPSTKNASLGGEGIHTKKMGTRFVNPEGRNKRSVWTINTGSFGGAHFAVFPEKIPELCIKAGSREGDTVFDPFMGSGTTASVAQRLSRKWIGIELNESYAEIIKQRTQQGELF